jgi:hypothetical protein
VISRRTTAIDLTRLETTGAQMVSFSPTIASACGRSQCLSGDRLWKALKFATARMQTFWVFGDMLRIFMSSLGIEDVRAYRLHLMQRGLKATSMYPIIGALRFSYGTTLGQKDMAGAISRASLVILRLSTAGSGLADDSDCNSLSIDTIDISRDSIPPPGDKIWRE